VRQDDFAHLERTLLQLAQEYRQAGERGDRDRQRLSRRAVIEAKDHARLVSHNPKVSRKKQLEKEEMVLWMMTWLENPDVFEAWVPLRKNHLSGGRMDGLL
jgi:asparagine synthetase B (glutamine-hydrolysing)